MRIDADRQGAAAGRAHERPFQPEIQGLRALAVLAVIAAHAGIPGLAGGFTGVDVFFVLSGFLITRLLLAEMARTGRIDLLAFWGRRARRLLPNAYAALIGTLLLGLLLFRAYTPADLIAEVTYAAFQIANFHFADKAVDYFQSDSPASPVLHFWSLSVEEQFYIIWPLLLVGIGLLPQMRRLNRVILVLGLIWCASFLAGVVYTRIEQPTAYFSTGTRCWQLATGALLAAGWSSIERLPAHWRRGLAWSGLVAILAGLGLIDEGGGYPGAIALLPTLGTAALIAGLDAEGLGSPLRRALSLPFMQWMGARSYSWYLWHWPLLALPRATFPDASYIAVIAVPASLAIACLAYSWLEVPLRHGRRLVGAPFATFAAAAGGLVLVIGAGQLYMPTLHLVDKDIAVRTLAIEAAFHDVSRASKEGCFVTGDQVAQPLCLYGDRSGRHRAVLFGDSHADHWFAAMNSGAAQAGWQLLVWTKSSCPPAMVRPGRRRSKDSVACEQWRHTVLERLTTTEVPDVVVIAASINRDDPRILDAAGRPLSAAKAFEAWRDGFRKTLRRLIDAGIKVVVMRDNPRHEDGYQSCLMAGGNCKTSRARAFISPAPEVEVAREFGDRVTLVDWTDALCDAESCPIMRDGTIIYRDTHHLTETFVATLAPLARALFTSLSPDTGRNQHAAQ